MDSWDVEFIYSRSKLCDSLEYYLVSIGIESTSSSLEKVQGRGHQQKLLSKQIGFADKFDIHTIGNTPMIINLTTINRSNRIEPCYSDSAPMYS